MPTKEELEARIITTSKGGSRSSRMSSPPSKRSTRDETKSSDAPSNDSDAPSTSGTVDASPERSEPDRKADRSTHETGDDLLRPLQALHVGQGQFVRHKSGTITTEPASTTSRRGTAANEHSERAQTSSHSATHTGGGGQSLADKLARGLFGSAAKSMTGGASSKHSKTSGK